MLCDFEPLNDADYRCRRCGLIVRGVKILPLIAECGAAGGQTVHVNPPLPGSELSDAGECANFGPELRRVACQSCQGHVQVKVFACQKHQECTLAKPLDGLACCATCEDFSALPGR